MDEFINNLDKNLRYENHEFNGEIYYIYVKSTRKKVNCTKCGQASSRVHSTYIRSFQDLPIQNKKVIVVINNRKMFCDNQDCMNRTFAETFPFLKPKSKKSKRLIEKIINISLNTSSITAASLLQDGVVNIGKSTICDMLKKTRFQQLKRKT